jgi:plastocyanin
MHSLSLFRNFAVVGFLFALSFAPGCGDEAAPSPDAKPRRPSRPDGLGPLGGHVDLSHAAEIRGQIIFSGDASVQRRALSLARDSWCAENHSVFDESLVVSERGGVAHALVYLEGLAEWQAEFPPPQGAATLEQVGCRYEPHALAIRSGQELRIVNADDTSHNVQILAKRNREVNFTQHRLDEIDTLRFERAELSMPLLCAFHPWMKGWIHVFAHPAFDLSDADGGFRIPGVPPGRYRLHFRHETLRGLPAPREINLAPGETLDLGMISVPN